MVFKYIFKFFSVEMKLKAYSKLAAFAFEAFFPSFINMKTSDIQISYYMKTHIVSTIK